MNFARNAATSVQCWSTNAVAPANAILSAGAETKVKCSWLQLFACVLFRHGHVPQLTFFVNFHSASVHFLIVNVYKIGSQFRSCWGPNFPQDVFFAGCFFFASVLRSRLWRFWTCSTPLGFRPVRACQVLNCKVCKQILDLIAMELIFPFALTCMWIDWRTYPTLVTFTCITLVTQIGKFKQMHSVGIKLSYIAPVPASRRVFGPWIQNLKHVVKILTLSDLQFDDHTNDDPTTSTGQLRFWPNLIASKRLCTLQHGTHFFYTCFCTSKPLWNHLIGCYCNFMV